MREETTGLVRWARKTVCRNRRSRKGISSSYQLAAAGPNGPVAATVATLQYGGGGANSASFASFGNQDNWLTFLGICYVYNGQPQGETIRFMGFQTNSGAPTCNS